MDILQYPRAVLPYALLTFKKNKLIIDRAVTKYLTKDRKNMFQDFSTRSDKERNQSRQKTIRVKPILKTRNEPAQLMENLNINEKTNNSANTIEKKPSKVVFAIELTRTKFIPSEKRECFIQLGPTSRTQPVNRPVQPTKSVLKNVQQVNIIQEEKSIVPSKVTTFNDYIAKQKQTSDKEQTSTQEVIEKNDIVFSPPITENITRVENNFTPRILSLESMCKSNEVDESNISKIEPDEMVVNDYDSNIDDDNIKEEAVEYDTMLPE